MSTIQPYGKRKTIRRYKRRPKVATKGWVYKKLDSLVEDKLGILTLASIGGIGNAWVDTSIGLPTQGDDVTNRTGNRIKLKSVEMYGVLGAGDANNVVRMVLALWNGGSATPMFSSGRSMDSPVIKDSNNQGLRRLYLSKYKIMQSESDASTGQVIFKYYKRFKKGIYITFGDNTATYPDKRLVFSLISDSGVAPNPAFTHGYIKVKFEDA